MNCWSRDVFSIPIGIVIIVIVNYYLLSVMVDDFDPVAHIGSTAAFNIVSGAVLWAIGDILAQLIERQSLSDYDAQRTGRQMIVGGVILAPLGSFWYWLLSVTFNSDTIMATAGKVILDQTIWATSAISLMFASVSVLQGKGLKHGIQVIHERLFNTMKANWMIWPFVQMCNFYLVPVQNQLVVVNAVSIPWTAFLSCSSYKGQTVKEDDDIMYDRAPLTKQNNVAQNG